MKNIIHKTFSGLLIIALFFAGLSCGKSGTSTDNSNPGGNQNITGLQEQINNLPKEPLNTTELNSLYYLREEEKLARDVYTFLFNKWGATVFSNIRGSEQTHTDAILMLLSKYNLTDPASGKAMGEFSNTNLQNLYNLLTIQGSTGLTEAYTIGATIEDLDLYDLKNAVAGTDNQDIRLVFDNLMKGSRNHLRSFCRNILNTGGTYTPQYISQAEFDTIINSPMETEF